MFFLVWLLWEAVRWVIIAVCGAFSIAGAGLAVVGVRRALTEPRTPAGAIPWKWWALAVAGLAAFAVGLAIVLAVFGSAGPFEAMS